MNNRQQALVAGSHFRKVVLDRRPHIRKRFIGQEYLLMIEIGSITYLVPHDVLYEIVRTMRPGTLKRDSWRFHGCYHWPQKPSELGPGWLRNEIEERCLSGSDGCEKHIDV